MSNHIQVLRPALERGWSFHTSWAPAGYVGADRAWGQCGVTSLWLFDELYGTQLMEGVAVTPDVARYRHFWVRVNNVDVDLTCRQFPVGTLVEYVRPTHRHLMITNDWFQSRYDHYRKAVML